MNRIPLALAAAALVAAAFALTPREPDFAPPSLAFVAPQPNAQLMLARVPVSLHLSGRLPPGRYALLLDGRLAAEGAIAPVVRYLPDLPLKPGRHQLSAYVFGRGYAWNYTWHVFVVRGAQASVRTWAASSRGALADVNAYRALAGERPMVLDIPLEGASRAHSDFFYRNLGRYGTLTISVHQEQSGWSGYVGRSPYSRDVAFGFNGDGDSEVMAFGVPIGQAVQLWIDSIYHRFGLIDPGLVEMGYGIAGKSSESQDLPVTTIDAGYLASAEVPDRVPVLWPARGLVGVSRAFEEGEIPDPLANFPRAHYPAGYPITISFFGERVSGLRIESASLQAGGAKVPAYLLTPQNEQNPEELGMSAALIPKSPTAANTVYHAAFKGSYRDLKGWHSFSYAWSFSTSAAPALKKAVALKIAQGPAVRGYLTDGTLYVPVRSLLSTRGGTLVWSRSNPDFATALAGGHELRFSYRSFAASLDGRPITLRHVPASAGKDPYVPAQEFASLLGLRLPLAMTTSPAAST
ncbi:MAG: CAP domain-containing protein [Thermaerobacter sp.]|nr:CAP domain-containing protein [Thermaerobacter sp.]